MTIPVVLLAVFALGFAAIPSGAGAASRAKAPVEAANASGADEAMHPDGVIVFEASEGLYVVSASGGQPRKIPGTLPRDGDPAWSPDGRQIAFDRGGEDRDIYVMNADGSDQRQLTRAPADDSYPRWAPHRRALTFMSNRDGQPAAYVINVGRGQARRIAYDGQYPDWGRDRQIMFADSNGNLLSVRPYGARRRLVEGATFDLQFHDTRISDDNSMIVFAPQGPGFPHRLYTARIDGASTKLVLKTSSQVFNPAWSPDGQWITFSGGPFSERLDVYVVRSDGTEVTRLTTRSPTGTACCSDWSNKATIH